MKKQLKKKYLSKFEERYSKVLLLFLIFLGSMTVPVWARVSVSVSILPQKYFVEKIGGDLVSVNSMVGEGNDPHHYNPKQRQMFSLSRSQLYFTIGLEFEKIWLSKLKKLNPKMLIVATDQGIPKQSMISHLHDEDEKDNHEKEKDNHEKEKDNHEKEKDDHEKEKDNQEASDPHIWLSPPLVKIQIKNIYTALLQIDPANEAHYTKNYAQFEKELDKVHRELLDIFLEIPLHSKFMIFHPTWGYFADAYGLEQIPIEIEGKTPKPSQLRELIEFGKKEKIRVIFVESKALTRRVSSIARALNGEIIIVNSLEENWKDNLRKVAFAFRRAIQASRVTFSN